MSIISPARRASRVDLSSNSSRRTNADFAREITIAEFGWHFARALDQADFLDRPSSQFPAPAPEASPQ